MAYKCALCKKGIMIGKQHTHHRGVAGGRWLKRAPKTQKVFKPNLHVTHIVINGMRKKVRLCTKCLRSAKKEMKKKIEISFAKTLNQSPLTSSIQSQN